MTHAVNRFVVYYLVCCVSINVGAGEQKEHGALTKIKMANAR